MKIWSKIQGAWRKRVNPVNTKFPPPGFYIHTQDGGWGFGYIYEGRRMFFYHGQYSGWSNLSEGHRSECCDNPAYCPWHGAL